jgi:hypothetical protein
MNVTVMDRKPDAINQSFLGFIDCDVHPFYKTSDEFDVFLPQHWRDHRRTIGGRTRQGLAKASNYPRMSPGNGQRMDAWPRDGYIPVLTYLSCRRSSLICSTSPTGCWRRWSVAQPASATLNSARQWQRR